MTNEQEISQNYIKEPRTPFRYALRDETSYFSTDGNVPLFESHGIATKIAAEIAAEVTASGVRANSESPMTVVEVGSGDEAQIVQSTGLYPFLWAGPEKAISARVMISRMTDTLRRAEHIVSEIEKLDVYVFNLREIGIAALDSIADRCKIQIADAEAELSAIRSAAVVAA